MLGCSGEGTSGWDYCYPEQPNKVTVDWCVWEYKVQQCVLDENIKKYTGKTVEECMQICIDTKDCVGFEYGVDYGGSGYEDGDCQPQSGTDTDGCDGADYNLDFYEKSSCNYADYVPPWGTG